MESIYCRRLMSETAERIWRVELSMFSMTGGSVLHDESNDWSRITQAVRVVPDAGFWHQRDVPAKFFVTLCKDAGVFFPRHDGVSLAVNVEQRDVRVGQRLQVIDGILVVGDGFGVGFEVKSFQHVLPFGSATVAFAKRPVAVDAVDVIQLHPA